MKRYDLRPVLSDEEAAGLAGEFLDESHYHTVLTGDTDIYRADGTPLLHFRKSQIKNRDGAAALKALYKAATEYGNRGVAAGKMKYHDRSKSKETRGQKQGINVKGDDMRFKYQKLDGTISKTNIAMTVPSGIIGGFDRNPRYPFCRLTKFTTDNPEKMAAAMPFIQQVNEVFKKNSPERYAVQLAACNRTHPDYIFPGTVFSTITVNKNWRTATHQDAGDLRSGFGVLSVLSEGQYSGGLFVVPKFGVAVDMRHGDVLLVDVHEWHGNTELVGISKFWTRLSTVFYFRSKMVGCKSLQDELEIAKRRVEGTSMYPDFEGDWPE